VSILINLDIKVNFHFFVVVSSARSESMITGRFSIFAERVGAVLRPNLVFLIVLMIANTLVAEECCSFMFG